MGNPHWGLIWFDSVFCYLGCSFVCRHVAGIVFPGAVLSHLLLHGNSHSFVFLCRPLLATWLATYGAKSVYCPPVSKSFISKKPSLLLRMVWSLNVLIGKHKVSHRAHPSLLPSHYLPSSSLPSGSLTPLIYPSSNPNLLYPFLHLLDLSLPTPALSFLVNLGCLSPVGVSQGTRGPKSNPLQLRRWNRLWVLFIPSEGFWVGHLEAAWDLLSTLTKMWPIAP